MPALAKSTPFRRSLDFAGFCHFAAVFSHASPRLPQVHLYRSDPVGLSRARPPHASNSPLRPRSWSRFTRVLWLSVCFPALYTRAQVASHPGAACRQRPRPPRARGRHFPARWTTSAHARPPKPPILPLRSRAARGPESGLCMCPLPPQVPSSAGLDSPVAAATYHLCSVSLEVCGRRSKPFLLVTRTLNLLPASRSPPPIHRRCTLPRSVGRCAAAESTAAGASPPSGDVNSTADGCVRLCAFQRPTEAARGIGGPVAAALAATWPGHAVGGVGPSRGTRREPAGGREERLRACRHVVSQCRHVHAASSLCVLTHVVMFMIFFERERLTQHVSMSETALRRVWRPTQAAKRARAPPPSAGKSTRGGASRRRVAMQLPAGAGSPVPTAVPYGHPQSGVRVY